MLGKILIRDVSGSTATFPDRAHDEFMDLRDKLETGKPILMVYPDRHVALNTKHIISIEWVLPK